PRGVPPQRLRHAPGHDGDGGGRRGGPAGAGSYRLLPAARNPDALAPAAAERPEVSGALRPSLAYGRMDRGGRGGGGMRERGELRIPFDTLSSQARASDPDFSIWVEANAGSGKTFVLTHRVLRLLLAGVRPQSILCLTYTKAAAAEMRKRVGARLAQWAVAGQGELLADIERLTGAAPSAELLDEARTLFARALETPGGLRILTIHAFCEAVLHRFPIEAGVPFDFAVIEEERQVQMVLSARESVLAEGLRGGAHAEAVEVLFGLLSDDAIAKAINSALAEGARLKPVLADSAGAKRRLRDLVGHDGTSAEAILEGVLA